MPVCTIKVVLDISCAPLAEKEIQDPISCIGDEIMIHYCFVHGFLYPTPRICHNIGPLDASWNREG